MEITVLHRKRGSKQDIIYNIEFISNYVFNEFNKLNTKVLKALETVKKIQSLSEDLGIKKAKNENAEDVLSQIENMKADTELIKDIPEQQWQILQELLESNDYDFDRNYWERTTQKDEVSKFLNTVFGANEEVKKKLGLLSK